MSSGIEVLTTTAIALALDAATLRQQAIASNIANANTVGYVPQRLSFESQMESARRALQDNGQLDAASLANVRLELEPVYQANGEPAKVQLDQQMAELAQNTVQYQALMKGLSRHLSILAQAASEGCK